MTNLYRHKYNEKTLTDILPMLSKKSIESLSEDLNFNTNLDVSNQAVQNSDTVYIFTDGNCKNNGKKYAKGAYGVYITHDKNSPYYKFNKVIDIDEPTNQKAELSAFKHVFQTLSQNTNVFSDKKIKICSDSMYSINCITKWYKAWEKNGWKTAKGDVVKNLELIKEIVFYKESIDKKISFELQHVMAHTVEPPKENKLKHLLWFGNYTVDKMINNYLSNSQDN